MTIQQKLILTVSIFCGAIIVTIVFIILPTIRDIVTINDHIYDQRVDLEKKYREGQLRHTALKNFEEIKNQQDKLIEPFISHGDELLFVTYLENLAEQYSVQQTILFDTIPDTPQATALPIELQLTIQGEFINTLNYLQALESSPYYIVFDAIRLNPRSRSLETNESVQLNLEGVVFAYHTSNEQEL